jgi:hypothetical protein
MPEETYLSILRQLKDAGFRGTISYSRYNEPMADIELLKKRTAQAREMLPDARLVTNTNGDFLRMNTLHGLEIDELSIMDYDCIGAIPCTDKLRRAGITIDGYEYPYIYGHYNNMKVLCYVNWPIHAKIEDRGGSIITQEKEKRCIPCMEPTYFVGIDYNGSVMPCCHLRSDNPQHASFILGNANNDKLEEILCGEKAAMFRKNMASDNPEYYYVPCMYCQKGPGRYTKDKPGIRYR